VKRKAILNAAIEVFLSQGYARTSVDTIASAAGVGKQTIYGHFGDKEKLFLAAVDEARTTNGAGDKDALITDTGDPRADLVAAGERILRTALSPRVAALHRLTIAELPYHADLQRFWNSTSSSSTDEIAAYLEHCDRTGVLTVPEPALAARQFAYVLISTGRVETLYGTLPLKPARRRAIARDSADLVVRAHRPDR